MKKSKRSVFKMVCLIALVAVVAAGMFSTIFASAPPIEYDETVFENLSDNWNAASRFTLDTFEPFDISFGDWVSTESSASGTRHTYSITDPTEIQNYLRATSHPSAGKDVEEILIIVSISNPEANMASLESTDMTPNSSSPSDLVRNITNEGIWRRISPRLRFSVFQSPGGSMTVTDSIAVQISGSATMLPDDILSIALGFSHTTTHTVSDTQNVVVPPNRQAEVSAYLLAERYEYCVWERYRYGFLWLNVGYRYVGLGRSHLPIGVAFSIVIRS